MKPQRILLFFALTILPEMLATPADAQNEPPLGFISKLGIDFDVRSGGHILRDELLSGQVILPESSSSGGGGSSTAQIQLRGATCR